MRSYKEVCGGEKKRVNFGFFQEPGLFEVREGLKTTSSANYRIPQLINRLSVPEESCQDPSNLTVRNRFVE